MTIGAKRPWRDVARELVNEQSPQKARELMDELSEAFQEHGHLDGPVLTISRPRLAGTLTVAHGAAVIRFGGQSPRLLVTRSKLATRCSEPDLKKIQACAAAIVSLEETKQEITEQYKRDIADLDHAIANFIANFKTLAASVKTRKKPRDPSNAHRNARQSDRRDNTRERPIPKLSTKTLPNLPKPAQIHSPSVR